MTPASRRRSIGRFCIGTNSVRPAIDPSLSAAGMQWVSDTGCAGTGINLGADEHGDGIGSLAEEHE
jgi:hypothetical protein